MRNRLIKSRPVIEFIGIIIIIFLFTFPRIEPDFGAGLDTSYVWALNHLFSNNYEILVELIYPFGPLAFLKMPIPEGSNLIVGLIFFTILKLLFIAALLRTFFSIKSANKAISVLLTLVISYFADTDLLIVGICTIQSILFIKKNSYLFFTGAVFVTMVGLFIKSSIGVNSFTIVFVSVIINFYYYKKIIPLLKLIIINLFIVLALGLLVFQDITLFFNYIINVITLTLGYSSALAVYPENNWFLLGVFILTVFSFPFLVKERDSRFVFILLLLPLFIIWKHSMSREDLTHTRIMLYFLFFFWGLLIGITNKKSFLLFFLSSISILSFYHNMSNLPGYSGYKIEISGINNFHESLIDYKVFFKKNSSLSTENIRQSKLEPEIRSLINNSSIDFYPWELSYVPANDLNWQPRRTLQSGSFSHWLDMKSAQSFERNVGPEYILFHFVRDQWGGNFGSIDGRYLMNDEPLTVYNIFNNYSIEKKTDKYLLLKKNKTNSLLEPLAGEKIVWAWNEWIDVPIPENDIVRIRFYCNSVFFGKVKEVLYKGETYYIDYQFKDGKVISYRFNPSNAIDGLWINPFIQASFSDKTEGEVTKVRFRNSNPDFISDSIIIQFERIKRSAPW
jgi:hypothetical protein